MQIVTKNIHVKIYNTVKFDHYCANNQKKKNKNKKAKAEDLYLHADFLFFFCFFKQLKDPLNVFFVLSYFCHCEITGISNTSQYSLLFSTTKVHIIEVMYLSSGTA